MKKIGDHNEDLHGNVPDTCSAALLLVDVLNDLDFPGAKPLIQAAPWLARNIAALKRRRAQAQTFGIFCNAVRSTPFVPSDCVAASSKKQHKMALELMKKSFGAHTAESGQLNLKRILSSGN